MRKAHWIVALAGVVLFSWVIAHMGFTTMLHEVAAVRVALPLVLLLSLCRLLLQTTAWSQALKDQAVSLSPSSLLGTRLAAQAMGYLTVLGPVLSEPMKIRMLRAPTEPTITATFLDDGVYWFTSTMVGIAGWLSLPLVALHRVHIAWVAIALLGLIASLLFFVRQKAVLSGITQRLGNRSPRWLTRASNLESSIRGHRLRRRDLVNGMFLIDLACQFLLGAEIVVVLWALHLPIHLLAVLAIDGVTRGSKLVAGWIPARLGSDEGGAISAFALAGFTPALGLVLALTRRVRDLLWALMGLAWLIWKSRNAVDRQAPAGETPTGFLQEAFR